VSDILFVIQILLNRTTSRYGIQNSNLQGHSPGILNVLCSILHHNGLPIFHLIHIPISGVGEE